MNVLAHRHQGVQTMLESDNLESHVTGGQDEHANSVKTHKHSDEQSPQHAQIMETNLVGLLSCQERCGFSCST